MTAATEPISAEIHSTAPPGEGWVRRYIFATDHKIIGIQYLFMGLIFFIVGGGLAMIMRWQLAWPGDGWVSAEHPGHPLPLLAKWLWPVVDAQGTVHGGAMPPEYYNAVFTLHSTIMVFFVLIPLLVGAFGTYLIPLKIGAKNLAFPRMSGFGFWLALVAGTIMLAGVFLPGGAASAGWTSYPPLSAILYNGAGHLAAARPVWLIPLQIAGSTWSAVPIIANFLPLVLLLGYVGDNLNRDAGSTKRSTATIAATTLIVLAAAAFAVRAIQWIAFDGQACWFLSLILLSLSSIMGAVNLMTTVLTRRCPGMWMFRLPLSVWNLFITSVLTLLATPVLGCLMVMNLTDHHRLTSFFEPASWVLSNSLQAVPGGGFPLIYLHLFWFYSHPAVYIMILPAMGFVSDILSVFACKPLFGYRPMILATAAIALLGFIVWGHHMFQSGMNPLLGTTFAVSTMAIAVPSGVKTFNWLATLWGGNIRLTVPLLNAVAFVSLFVIGGLSGIFMAASAVDVQLHMTYFIVAHIHYVLFGGSTFGIFAGIYYWYPKMFGRMMNDTLGYVHFGISYIAFNCTFFAMHILGLQGFPRRVADYRNYGSWAHLQPMNQFISISAFCLMAGQLPFVLNFFGSMIWGQKAPNNPWQATTLEWETTSPPPLENFEIIPTVYRGPYEFSGPLVEQDWLPQARKL